MTDVPETTPTESTEQIEPAGPPAPAEAAETAVTAAGEPATAEPAEVPSSAPRPTPAVPSPAALASRMAAKPAPPTVAPVVHAHSDSARFGRVSEDGTVYVIDGEDEREVGSYPGATAEDALQYFARKFDELSGNADLLAARVDKPEVPSKDVAEALKHLTSEVGDAKVVGDLHGLRERLSALEAKVAAKREAESVARAEARAAASTEREAIVSQAEHIAAQPEGSTQWKRSSEQMRGLLDQWKEHQRSSARLDKTTENALWQRFSAARNSFDKARRSHFAHLDETRSEAKSAKERLVSEAEALSTSKDWAPTARAFKNLMDQWRQAGRAARGDDDSLWERFKAAQDAFFSAKDEVSAAEDEAFRANLTVKEALMAEAEALLPVKDLEGAKSALRVLQDKWDKAGKVPRADVERTEKAMRRVESAVREAEERKWKASNPEVAARASSMVTQLENSIAGLREDKSKAEVKGNAAKAADLQSKIEAQEQWLAQAKAGLDEFGS